MFLDILKNPKMSGADCTLTQFLSLVEHLLWPTERQGVVSIGQLGPRKLVSIWGLGERDRERDRKRDREKRERDNKTV